MKNLETPGKIGIGGSKCCGTKRQAKTGVGNVTFAKGERLEKISQAQGIDVCKKTNQTVRSADH